MFNKFVLALVAVALVTLACGINIDLPGIDHKTGPTRIEEITVPFLDDPTNTAKVTIAFGAGRLNIDSGGTDALLAGTATFNVADIRPELSIDEELIRLEQGNLDFNGIPSFSNGLENQWDLVFGDAPIELVINAGAYSGRFELGGLSIERLEINDGAADVNVAFSQPNRTTMSLFEYTTGASNISIEGLANTNCEDLVFKSGAGSYTLDFSGELMRDMVVFIESGVSSVTIILPEGTAAVLNTSGGLMSVSATGSWEQDGSRYTVEGDGFTITFHVDMGAGSLVLETR
jgi:hypothetical protein